MPKLLSSRTPVTPAEKLSHTRYKYLSLGEAQPSLGVPKENGSILLGNVDGTTSWVKTTSIISNTKPTKNLIFVAKNGSDSNVGDIMSSPKQTIASAIKSAVDGTTIYIFGGHYIELNPLHIPANVTIIAQESSVVVEPYVVDRDVFYLNDNTAIHGITVQNHRAPSNAFSLDPTIDGGITISNPPIIKNCTTISGPYLVDKTLFVPNETIQEAGSIISVAVSGVFSSKSGSNIAIPQSSITEPDLPNGTKPILEISFPASSSATVAVIDAGSGYNVAPFITLNSSIGGGTGTPLLTATIVSALPAIKIPRLDSEVTSILSKRINKQGAGGGVFIDGDYISSNSLTKEVIIDNFTANNQGGIGVVAQNVVTISATNCKTLFCTESFSAKNGAILTLKSCSTEYGNVGLKSDGYANTGYITGADIYDEKYSSIKSINLVTQNGTILGGTGYTDPVTITIGRRWVSNINLTQSDNFAQLYYGNNLYLITITSSHTAITPPTHTSGILTHDGITYRYTGTIATATATVVGGTISNIELVSPGYGYINAPEIHIIGSNGSGSGASAIAQLNLVTEITVQNITKQPHVATLFKVSSQIGPEYSLITSATAEFFQTVNTLTDGSNPIIIQPSGELLLSIAQGTPSATGGVGVSTITLFPGVPFIIPEMTIDFFYSSKITATNHYFNSIGAGVTHNAYDQTTGIPTFVDANESNWGKIYYSALDDRGIYKFNELLSLNLLTDESSSMGSGYLSELGGIVNGETTLNDLLFSNNQISSIYLNENIIMAPNGTGVLDLSNHKISNIADPVGNQDAATKQWVNNLLQGATPYAINGSIGNFTIIGDTISSIVNNGDMNLVTSGSGKVHIKSLIDSQSTTSGAFVVDGGVAIAKNLNVGASITANSFFGSSFSGTANSAITVLGSTQTNINRVGTLLSLQVGPISINNNIISVDTGSLIIGSNDSSANNAVLPVLDNQSDFGSLTKNWKVGYFQTLYGTIANPDQTHINALNYAVTMYDPTVSNIAELNIGYNTGNRIQISTEATASHISVAKFKTITSQIGSNVLTDIQFLPNNNLSLTISKNGNVTIGSTTDSTLNILGSSINGTATIASNVIGGTINLFRSVTGTIVVGGSSISSGNGNVKLGISPKNDAISTEITSAEWVFNNRPFLKFSSELYGTTNGYIDNVSNDTIGRAFTIDKYRSAKFVINAIQLGEPLCRTQYSEVVVSHDAPFVVINNITSVTNTISLSSIGGIYQGMNISKYNDNDVGSVPNGTKISTILEVSTTLVNIGSFVKGQKYKIKTSGNADWGSVGASSNAIGTVFIATGVGNSFTSGIAYTYSYTLTLNNYISISSISLKCYVSSSFSGTLSVLSNTNIISFSQITYTQGAVYPGMILQLNSVSYTVLTVSPSVGITLTTPLSANSVGNITGMPNIYITEYGVIESNGVVANYQADQSSTINNAIVLYATPVALSQNLIYKTIFNIEKEMFLLG